MKNKFVIVALIAMILVGGMVLMACNNCDGDGKCEIKYTDAANVSKLKSLCFYDSKTFADTEKWLKGWQDCLGTGASGTLKCGC